jgi:hypothetical protein
MDNESKPSTKTPRTPPLTAALLVLILAVAQRARADDWLASLPACSSAHAQRDPSPRFELVYPRSGLPALVAAGEALIARVRVPAPLTPPPGVQQPRALLGWRAELAGHALPVEVGAAAERTAGRAQRHSLEVVDVRPDGASTLLYRASIPIPAWAAPGTYDLALWAPGGSGRALGVVRVLAPGAAPRVAWMGAEGSSRLSDASAAALPVDVWVRAASRQQVEPSPAPAPRAPAAAPELDLGVAALALRVGAGLWVVGGCGSQAVAFDAEVASVMARERRTRITPPPPPSGGQWQSWGEGARAWPEPDSLRVQRAGGVMEIGIEPGFGATAELSLLLAAGGSGVIVVTGVAAAAQEYYPASEIAAGELPARVLRLRVAAGERARITPAAAASAPAAYALRVEPQPARSGERVRLSLERVRAGAELPRHRRADRAGGELRVAWRLDPLHTAFGRAQVEHRFLPLGRQRVAALVIGEDGRVQRLRGEVIVETARASSCGSAVGTRESSGASWLWPALWLVQRRGRLDRLKRRPRSAARNRLRSESGSERAYRDGQNLPHRV